MDFIDFLLVSIIKYKNKGVYRRLYDGEFTTSIIRRNKIEVKDNITGDADIYTDILVKLFPKNSKSTIGWNRKINNIRAFSIYFIYMTFNLIPRKDLETILNGAWIDAKEWVDNVMMDKRYIDLKEFLTLANFMAFGNKVKLENFIRLVFYTNATKDNPNLSTITTLLSSHIVNQIISEYKYISIDEYKKFIISILKDGQTYYHNIIGQFLVNLINDEIKEYDIIFSKEELLQFNLWYLEHAIKEKKVMDDIHMSIFYLCIQSINRNTQKITLERTACNYIHKLISENPEYYISNFVRLESISSNPKFNGITCEPFWKQIFGNEERMKSFIFSDKLKKYSKSNRVRNFWLLYEKNNYKAIEGDGEWNVQEQIDNDLTVLIKYLDKMINLEKEFIEYNNKLLTQALTINNEKKYKAQLQKFLDALYDIPLEIEYKDDVTEKIKRILDDY